jgi:peptide subunit release factor 1 (eRF1)
MKVSLYIPANANLDDIRSFLRREIAEARNIKSKATRKSVSSGLNKILLNLQAGMGYLTDGNELVIEPYDGI